MDADMQGHRVHVAKRALQRAAGVHRTGAAGDLQQSKLDTLRGTLNSVRLHAKDFATQQGRIQTLQAMSDSAEGRMQALQLGNMMAGEQLQQLVKLRQLIMAQTNAQNVYMANQINREAQRAATQSEWVRNGNADAPPLVGR